MKSWEEVIIYSGSSIRQALIKIDSSGTQMILVADAERKLLGTLSDGDIRRGLLKGLSLSSTVDKCMFLNPYVVKSSDGPDSILDVMKRNRIHQIPIVDADGRIEGLEVLDDFVFPAGRKNWVVIMAGGLGSRLGELTKNTPKPMLHVGGRPLLETILLSFIDQGFRRFYFSVNYKADLIEKYFGNGDLFGVEIKYLKEEKPLGTAGALSLLPEIPTEPIIVTNGDLLAKVDYAHMIDAHIHADIVGTMGVSEFEYQIPYGVIHTKEGLIHQIEEKPVFKSLISGGMNILSPSALDFVPADLFIDMPELFEKLIEQGIEVRPYKVHEYWLDIGRVPDYQKANEDIASVFPFKIVDNEIKNLL